MNPHEIIEAAKAAGYELWPDGKVIDFKPKPMRDKQLANCIRANKPKLLEALRRREQSIVAAFDAAICWREYVRLDNATTPLVGGLLGGNDEQPASNLCTDMRTTDIRDLQAGGDGAG